METKIKKIQDFIIIICITLFTMLPDYFYIGTQFYKYLIVIVLFIILYRGVEVKKVKYYLSYMLPVLMLAIISYGYHKEIFTFLTYILTVFMPGFIVFSFINKDSDLKRIIYFLITVAIILCVFGIVEWITEKNVFSLIETIDLGTMGTRVKYRDDRPRIQQSFGQPITFALYLFFIFMLAFTQEKNNKKDKIVCISTMLLSFVGVYLTAARFPFITLILFILFIVLNRNKKEKILLFGFLFLILCLDLATKQIIFSKIINYTTLIKDAIWGIINRQNEVTDMNTTYRLQLIPILLPFIKQKFFFGYGNVFMSSFTFKIFGFTHTSIDNSILSNMMSHGFIGLIVFIMPIIYGIVFSIKLIKRKDNNGKYYLCFLILYCLNLISVAQLSEKRIMIVFIAILMAKYYNSSIKENGGDLK